jgi:hypothetical protein
MALVKRRMVNPAGPSVLALVNPKRRRKTKMATRKRKASKRRASARRNPVNPVNPTRRRRSTKRRGRRSTVYARRRNPINPTRRRRYGRRRHRNPFGGGGEVIDFAGAGIGLGLAQPLFGRFIGPYLPFGQYNSAALTAITGWGLSKLFEMFGFTRRFAKPARILGYSTAVIQIVQPIVSRAMAGAGALANPTGMGARYRRPGMNGIGVMTGIPPGMALSPPQVNNGQSMQGIGVMTNIPPGMAR